MKIGILADWLGLGFEGNILKSAEMGADGVQLYAVEGELAPENMDAAARRKASRFVRDTGLVISAICGDLGGGGFAFPADNAAKIARTKEIVDLALDLGCNIVTTHIGVVPADPGHERFRVIADALSELGAYAESRGAVFAIETGPEKSEDLLRMLRTVGSRGIGVNLDPGNLVMCHNESPVVSVGNLKDFIVHTHAKDGRLLRHCDMDIIYGMVPAPEGFDENEYCVELPLGEGDVHFETYLPALKAAGFDGFLTIERECGEDPQKDIGLAIDFLRALL